MSHLVAKFATNASSAKFLIQVPLDINIYQYSTVILKRRIQYLEHKIIVHVKYKKARARNRVYSK